jgi:predicted ATPase
VSQTDVGVVAITNHNHFDLSQYNEIVAKFEAANVPLLLWPGVELDISEGQRRGHLLVIAPPERVDDFDSRLAELTKDTHPDAFLITIQEVIASFDHLQPLYVAHYNQKKPDLSEEGIYELEQTVSQPWCVIKEVTNAISAGIYISHGEKSIYGSDVKDWSTYQADCLGLPELRLPVDSFNQFKLLLKRDESVINTLLEKKTPHEFELFPFGPDEPLRLEVYNDINIIFGPKGTGKTCLLESIAKWYSDAGMNADVFYSGSERLEELFDKEGKNLTVDLDGMGLSPCGTELDTLYEAEEVGITPLERYVNYFRARRDTAKSKKIAISDIVISHIPSLKNKYDDTNGSFNTINGAVRQIESDRLVKEITPVEEYDDLMRRLSLVLERLWNRKVEDYIEWKEAQLSLFTIETIAAEVARKTFSPIKPTRTGFQDYVRNRVKIKNAASTILSEMSKGITNSVEFVGNLGPNKGKLEFVTEYVIQDGTVSNTKGWIAFGGQIKNNQKSLARHIEQINKKSFDEDLFSALSKFRDEDNGPRVKSLAFWLLFRRYFTTDGKEYSPSSGESSMVRLQRELMQYKDIYLLDEPEKSLGNEYINNVIVPLIKRAATSGSRLFIATHDANIAVRTLPFCSIYRVHDDQGYHTYTGNPFLNRLTNISNQTDHLDWKETSMRTLEGGQEAFGERGMIYGQN